MIIVGKHVHDHHLGIAVVIQIRGVHAHRIVGGMHQCTAGYIREPGGGVRTIQEVVRHKVVRHVEFRLTVAVEVLRHAPEAPAFADPDVVRLFEARQFRTGLADVSVQAVYATPAARRLGAFRDIPVVVLDTVIDNVEVEVTVAVVVDPYRVGAVALVGQSDLRGGLPEHRHAPGIVALVQEEAVRYARAAVRVEGDDVDVLPSVSVHVGYVDASAPVIGRDAGYRGHIGEGPGRALQVEPAGGEIAGEEEVGMPVAVEVPYPDAAAVVEVLVVEYVDGVVFGNGVDEVDARYRRVQLREALLRFPLAGNEEAAKTEGEVTERQHGGH